MSQLSRQKILFRVDGNQNIGLGHISRCLALAELLLQDFDVSFAIREPEEYVLREVQKITPNVIALPHSPDSLAFNDELNPFLTGSEIVVMDGYSFTSEYEATVKKKCAALIAIDDLHNRHFYADGIINFCGAINPADYSKEYYTQLYLGLDYLFLRSPFLRPMPISIGRGNKLLINMGGSDPGNQTSQVIQKILQSGFSEEIIVVIGNGYRFKEQLAYLINTKPFISLRQGLTPNEMYELMRECSTAILPPSTVALEYLSLGGTLFLNLTAENQRCIRNYLLKQKLAFDFEEFIQGVKSGNSLVTRPDIKAFFDGSSLFRVKKVFTSLSLSTKIKFRKASSDDIQTVYNWANDPEVRKQSYSKNEIVWQKHVEWFNEKISNTLCEYLIVDIDNDPVGQLRFDHSVEEGVYVISYLIDGNWRGNSLGSYVLIKGVKELAELRATQKIIGYVQRTNISSIKAFQRAGFSERSTEKYPNSVKFEISI